MQDLLARFDQVLAAPREPATPYRPYPMTPVMRGLPPTPDPFTSPNAEEILAATTELAPSLGRGAANTVRQAVPVAQGGVKSLAGKAQSAGQRLIHPLSPPPAASDAIMAATIDGLQSSSPISDSATAILNADVPAAQPELLPPPRQLGTQGMEILGNWGNEFHRLNPATNMLEPYSFNGMKLNGLPSPRGLTSGMTPMDMETFLQLAGMKSHENVANIKNEQEFSAPQKRLAQAKIMEMKQLYPWLSDEDIAGRVGPEMQTTSQVTGGKGTAGKMQTAATPTPVDPEAIMRAVASAYGTTPLAPIGGVGQVGLAKPGPFNPRALVEAVASNQSVRQGGVPYLVKNLLERTPLTELRRGLEGERDVARSLKGGGFGGLGLFGGPFDARNLMPTFFPATREQMGTQEDVANAILSLLPQASPIIISGRNALATQPSR